MSGNLQYGNGAGGGLNGCDVGAAEQRHRPFAPGSLTGLVVLVDRGACDFSLKIANIALRRRRSPASSALINDDEPFAGALGALPGRCLRSTSRAS